MYIQDFYLIKIKCFDGVEPRLTGEIGEKPEVVAQMIQRLEKMPLDSLIDIESNGLPEINSLILLITTTEEMSFDYLNTKFNTVMAINHPNSHLNSEVEIA